ncbi:MAG: hypothetical protein GWN00_29120 [Aliifodinibius sp.]|nr:hypothetical protein [Fodinibius sp.]NIV14833.1 hypothetical protein [Fodinibius sp.]NIY28712.1 hypothetical protein [Fodinibius sp.]
MRSRQDICSIQEFRALLEYERARVDRNEHVLSLIVFEVSEAESDGMSNTCLESSAARRVRCTDVIGWLDKRRLGIFLPDTPDEGAWRLANDICQLVDLPTNSFKIYTYPSKGIITFLLRNF